jgi:hypothetical protein
VSRDLGAILFHGQVYSKRLAGHFSTKIVKIGQAVHACQTLCGQKQKKTLKVRGLIKATIKCFSLKT